MPDQFENRRSIGAAALERLLQRLGPDRERAALEYERLRRALVKFFDWRGAWAPDECADETMDRLARKLEDTVVDDVTEYARGIARLVLLERRRLPVHSPLDDRADRVDTRQPDVDDDEETLRQCFDRCLDDVSRDGRTLLVSYYEGERAEKISNRRRIASRLGLSENALRSRVQRLRDRLEACVRSCLSRSK